MPVEAFGVVLLAAVMHAIWNAFLKADGDRLSVVKTMSQAQLLLSVVLLPFVSFPAAASWPLLIASAVVNVGYMLFLVKAYRTGDLSHVYPLARGVAPLLVAGVSMALLDVHLDVPSQLAILLIGLGVTSLSLARGADGLRDWRMVAFAIGSGCFIAAYTLLDGLGARAAGSAHGYMVWLSILTSALIIAAVSWFQRDVRTTISRRTRLVGMGAGLASYFGAWAIIWAMTVAPIPLVSALRETSIVFAVIIGLVVFNESMNLRRLASVASTLLGVAIMKFSR
ncbi:drug/metabolite transporter (DMT)-like permease [Aminobacter lissarensis]|uniref:Drug/metabolite transporter (DMT)-like permease n=1 Tax=Aminobacter carboxidus TaxID=376165 RepID=A0A8E2BCX8_9HYPH|nr:EamA family transporter [Aminobacter lissarensis]MBB6466689.1 drug/metabolite transporter (DMT)-like permease [Aminobacter lissarensis]